MRPQAASEDSELMSHDQTTDGLRTSAPTHATTLSPPALPDKSEQYSVFEQAQLHGRVPSISVHEHAAEVHRYPRYRIPYSYH
jgi:hypothetical protein